MPTGGTCLGSRCVSGNFLRREGPPAAARGGACLSDLACGTVTPWQGVNAKALKPESTSSPSPKLRRASSPTQRALYTCGPVFFTKPSPGLHHTHTGPLPSTSRCRDLCARSQPTQLPGYLCSSESWDSFKFLLALIFYCYGDF